METIVMIRTASKFVPAVALVAVLGTAWASAATPTRTPGATAAPTSAAPPQDDRPVPAAAPATEAPPQSVPPGTAVHPADVASVAQPRVAAKPAGAPSTVEKQADRATGGEAPAGCATGEGTYRPATEAAFRTAVTGVWLLCRPPSVFGTPEAGMELRADGRWSKLERRPNGSLARAEGGAGGGAWDTVDTTAMNGGPTYQLNLSLDGGGTSMTTPGFGQGSNSSLVTKLRLDNMGLFVADYVPAPAGTMLPPVMPAPDKHCEGPEKPYSPISEAEFRAAMTRVWLLCGTPSFFGTNEDGLEIRADGRWFKLYRTSRDALERGNGPGDGGTWETFDTSAMNGRPTYQINFNSTAGGTHMATPTFDGRNREVSRVRLDNMGTFVADYVPAPNKISITGA
jgi:hypothetical protein